VFMWSLRFFSTWLVSPSFPFLHLSLIVMVLSSRSLFCVVGLFFFLFLSIWLVSPMV
ncbi:uncharacterized protein BX664DRAFT_339069, partial [Halteromyces radiatus]|uniref:uncharacterized protein n=1 Tax=Halteromyces radiatus TaxID=101107 RepID=UPI00221F2DC6